MFRDYRLAAYALFAVVILIPAGSLFPGFPILQPSTIRAEDLAKVYKENGTYIIWWSLMSGLVGLLLAPPVAVIAAAMLKMQPRSFMLIFLHLICGSSLVLCPFIGSMLFLAPAYHSDMVPDVILAFHETGKFILMVVMPFIMWSPVMAIAILKDRAPDPILPKWFAWVSIVFAVITQTYTFAPLFKSGIWGVDGFMGLVFPLILLEIYFTLMAIVIFRIKPELWQEADVLPAL